MPLREKSLILHGMTLRGGWWNLMCFFHQPNCTNVAKVNLDHFPNFPGKKSLKTSWKLKGNSSHLILKKALIPRLGRADISSPSEVINLYHIRIYFKTYTDDLLWGFVSIRGLGLRNIVAMLACWGIHWILTKLPTPKQASTPREVWHSLWKVVFPIRK